MMNTQKQHETAAAAPESPQMEAVRWHLQAKNCKTQYEFLQLDDRQRITAYTSLLVQRDELLAAAKWSACCTGEYLYGDSANPVCDYARKDIEHALDNLKSTIANCEKGAK
jgi:hypothetical protein